MDSPEKLAQAVAVQDRRIETLEKTVLDNGRMGLEKRMTKLICEEIAAVKKHNAHNIDEGDQLVLHELQHEREERTRQHEENKMVRSEDREDIKAMSKTLDKIKNWGLAIAMALFLLRGLEDAGIIKIAGAQEAKQALHSFIE